MKETGEARLAKKMTSLTRTATMRTCSKALIRFFSLNEGMSKIVRGNGDVTVLTLLPTFFYHGRHPATAIRQ